MNQKQIWIDLLYAAKYEIEMCIDSLTRNATSKNNTLFIMERVEITGRHLLNLALEMKMELKK